MDTPTCPTCGATWPVGTRAMTTCCDCGRPVPPTADPSVRPPTVDPVDLPEPDRDPLAEWDLDAVAITDRPTPDWVVVAASAATGLVAGIVVAPRGRAVTGGLVGSVVGLVGAGIRRTVWRIDAPDGSWARRQGT